MGFIYQCSVSLPAWTCLASSQNLRPSPEVRNTSQIASSIEPSFKMVVRKAPITAGLERVDSPISWLRYFCRFLLGVSGN